MICSSSETKCWSANFPVSIVAFEMTLFFRAICFLSLLSRLLALICPIYNLNNNETERLSSCDDRCRFFHVQSPTRRCLGIYKFERNPRTKENRIFIRQLAVLDDLEHRYRNRTDCLLELDKFGQNLYCRCNAANCTLNWKINANLSSWIEEKDETNWFFPLLMIFSIVVLTIVVVILILIPRRSRKTSDKDQRSVLTDFSTATTTHFFTDEVFQSVLTQGKTSNIYRTSIDEKEQVALKVYHGQQYKTMFENEVTILKMIQHSTIVSFIGAGWHGPLPYLILEYHELGSLQNYLSREKLSWSTCYSFLHSLLQAIDYLHYEDLSPDDYFTGNRVRKPIIVHRDVKSANLLVKSSSPLTLSLIDFGLAKVLPTVLTTNDFVQIGTYRYMAPELLELAISHTSEALCKVDMYAVALVMWEIVTQCDEYPHPVDYQLPYLEFLSTTETNENRVLDTLHRVVVNERKRPIFHRTSEMNSKLFNLFGLIEDCWKHDADSRLNARPALSRLVSIKM